MGMYWMDLSLQQQIGEGSWRITPRRLSQLTREYDCSMCSRMQMRCKSACLIVSVSSVWLNDWTWRRDYQLPGPSTQCKLSAFLSALYIFDNLRKALCFLLHKKLCILYFPFILLAPKLYYNSYCYHRLRILVSEQGISKVPFWVIYFKL